MKERIGKEVRDFIMGEDGIGVIEVASGRL